MGSKKKSEIGLVAREALDADVIPIEQQNLHRHWCGPAFPRVTDGPTGFVIRVQGGEIRIRSSLEFLPRLQLINSKRRRPDP